LFFHCLLLPLLLRHCFHQIQVLVKHVSNEVLEKIEAAAADLFLLEGHDALQKRVEEEAKKVGI
jgi:hypothetical protein